MHRYADNVRGFTLVELMVIIAIISVLMAILLPSLRQARYVTRITICASNLRQITIGSTVYATENQRLYPNGPPVGNSHYPENVDRAMRQQVHNAQPAVLGEYVGGSVSPAQNALMRCPQIMANGEDILYNSLSSAQYMLFYNASANVRSGSTVVPNTAGVYALPNEWAEAMPRTSDTRIQNANFRSGAGVWKSAVVASDVSFLRVTSKWRIGTGHMRGGVIDDIGGAQLRGASPDATATANYAFQDGSVARFTFTADTVTDNMIYIDDGSGGGAGGYLLPEERIRQIP